MPRVTRIVSIDAPNDKVIDYISNVENHPAFISALKSVDNINGDYKKPGTSWDWTFVMSGVELKGKAKTQNYEPGKVYSFKTDGSINSTFTYSVEPEDSGTRLSIDVDYEIPKNVLGKVVDAAVIERLNEQEAEQGGNNLKAILEG
ncbi:MAG: hypothetical protein COT81_04735 [Candidatus Buchananbacteria bacterium CG10_big_fil_rev_8_21_14_0_10_42_9]|uniref:Cyclase n=1 Tax=Candidatus Buchananbacteria bacterium CG10_big_fil_rev_8_21_14_0_10_42_9 TaxID=1974526 RepID=A0A2H0W080_9BACT|nr:MAG: hypothetical protein COT81_04735 [Candidatus Buchananbacteria bacterium CG10_big_fil_rev_8_21_14_0_10_42_9]